MRREFPALGFNPAPGDPVAVTAAAERAATAARTFDSSAERLDRLAATAWTGDAADAFRARIGRLPNDLDRASCAYRVTARALADYGAGLTARQRHADDLEQRATLARSREAAAIVDVNRLAASAARAGSAEFSDLRARYAAARTHAEAAGGDVEAIVREARRLHAEHDAAASATATSIRSASDAPYERPGRLRRALDRVKKWMRDHEDVLAGISTILKGISAVLGGVSLVPGLQFLAPFAIAAGALALALDTAIKLATGRGSWRALALDVALTVLPTGRVARSLKKIHAVDIGLKCYNRKIPNAAKGRLFRRLGHLPEGMTRAQVERARTLIREQAGHYGDDVIVHGSRGDYTAFSFSDIDIGLRVSPEEFARIHKERFSVNVHTQQEKDAVVNSMTKGIIHGPRAGLRALGKELKKVFDVEEVDISVIRRGGQFDPEPWIRL